MTGNRFDGISRGFARRFSRRAAVRGLGGAGVLGLAGAAPGGAVVAVRQDDEDVCILDFQGTVRLGPSQGDRRAGEFTGELRFGLDRDGAVTDGALRLRDAGGVLPVTGQATGSSLTLRIAVDEDDDTVALVAIGAGERDVSRCRGIYSGLLAGPAPGDIGDWTAAPPDPGTKPPEPPEPDEDDTCPESAMLDCEIGCDDDEDLTYDCTCVTTGSAACDRECPDAQTLTDDCECVCLQ